MTNFKGTPNLAGRPKNALNKNTNAVKECFNTLLECNLEKLQDDINQLKPYERVKVILELANYMIPKLKAVEVTNTDNENYKPIILDISLWK
jgi:hypothetical protein